MFRACYVIQRMDTGEFLGNEDGQKVYFINFAKAHIFDNLEEALNYARDIDPYLMEITVHGFYQFVNYQTLAY